MTSPIRYGDWSKDRHGWFLGLSGGACVTIGLTGLPTLLPAPALAVTSAALLTMAIIRPDLWMAVVLTAITGFGMGTVMSSAQILVQTTAGPKQVGVATAAVSLFRAIGSAGGTAIFGAVVFGVAAAFGNGGDSMAVTPAASHALGTGFQAGFAAAALMTAGAALAMARVPKTKV